MFATRLILSLLLAAKIIGAAEDLREAQQTPLDIRTTSRVSPEINQDYIYFKGGWGEISVGNTPGIDTTGMENIGKNVKNLLDPNKPGPLLDGGTFAEVLEKISAISKDLG